MREQDEDAARTLVEHLYPMVMRVVRANLPRRQDPEDLAQEVFGKVFAKMDQFRGEVPLEHWVSRIAVNHCISALRRQSRQPELRMADLSEEQVDALAAATAGPASDPHPAQRIAARELVDLLLQGLDPQDRLLMRMLEMDELTVQDVREVTGWSSVNIRVRAFRARRKLNERFRDLRKEGRL